MHKILLLALCVIILNGINATGAVISDEDIDEFFGFEDKKDSEVPFHQIPEDSSGDIQKRSNPNALIRRSSLDKNFMRFGRSSFFPNDRCCKHRDTTGFISLPNSADLTQERGPSEYRQLSTRSNEDNFIRFGRPSLHKYIRFERDDKNNFMRLGRGDKDNFIRFRRGDQDNFMRFGRSDKDNFMRFGRGDQDNFMRFGRSDKDSFMRFGRGDQDNFMRFGRGDQDNFMRFGRSDKDSFMRFGRGDQDNFMRFGRSDKDNFMRFGRDDGFMRFGRKDKENFIRFGRDNENFIRFGKADADAHSDVENFMELEKSDSGVTRHGNPGGKDEKFISFARNGTTFSRLGPEEPNKEERLYSKNVLLLRRKRTAMNEKIGDRNLQLVNDDLAKRSSFIEENILKPNLLKFISMINNNRPTGGTNKEQGPLSQVLSYYPDQEKYKRKQGESSFIRFG